MSKKKKIMADCKANCNGVGAGEGAVIGYETA